MRYLGIDYGLARIGVAKSDPTGFLAQSYGVLRRRSDADAIEELAGIVEREQVEALVVGLPITMKGERKEKALAAEAFAAALHERTGLPVALHDERLTTVAAERVLLAADMRRQKRKQVIDAVAATILLQSYLDGHK